MRVECAARNTRCLGLVWSVSFNDFLSRMGASLAQDCVSCRTPESFGVFRGETAAHLWILFSCRSLQRVERTGQTCLSVGWASPVCVTVWFCSPQRPNFPQASFILLWQSDVCFSVAQTVCFSWISLWCAYLDICNDVDSALSDSDRLHFVGLSLDIVMFLQRAFFHSSSWLSHFPSCSQIPSFWTRVCRHSVCYTWQCPLCCKWCSSAHVSLFESWVSPNTPLELGVRYHPVAEFSPFQGTPLLLFSCCYHLCARCNIKGFCFSNQPLHRFFFPAIFFF